MPKNFTCIVCPRGCNLTIDEIMNVTGNSCKRGEAYAKQELVKPMRTITSTMKVEGGEINRVPVKTSTNIPKEMIFDVMNAIRDTKVKAPIKTGDVLIENVLSLDCDIVACRDIKEI